MRNAIGLLWLWPAFLVAGIAEMAFFSLFMGQPIEAGRTAIYSIGFFGFWSVAALSSALTHWLGRPMGDGV